MRSRAAVVLLTAGIIAGAPVFLDVPLGDFVLLVAALLVPAAVVAELAARRDSRMTALIGTLFACGVLIFADERAVGVPAFFATVALLFATGFVQGHVRAVLWAVVCLASAIVADVLWQLDLAAFDRDAEYEPIPVSPFVLIGLPVPMAIIALGVGARRLWRFTTGKPRARRPDLHG
jgi:hypothetical protein